MTIIFYFSLPSLQSSWLSTQGSKHFAHLYLDIHSIPDSARKVHSERTSKTHLSSPVPLELNKSGLRKYHISRVTWWVWDESRREGTRLAAGQRTLHHTVSCLVSHWVGTPIFALWYIPAMTTSSPTYITLSLSRFLRNYHHLTFYVYLYIH